MIIWGGSGSKRSQKAAIALMVGAFGVPLTIGLLLAFPPFGIISGLVFFGLYKILASLVR